jgi:hypothetical protein
MYVKSQHRFFSSENDDDDVEGEEKGAWRETR